jgi:hypothetical protein
MVICEVSFGCIATSMKKCTNAGIAGDVRSQDCFTSTLSKSSRKRNPSVSKEQLE